MVKFALLAPTIKSSLLAKVHLVELAPDRIASGLDSFDLLAKRCHPSHGVSLVDFEGYARGARVKHLFEAYRLKVVLRQCLLQALLPLHPTVTIWIPGRSATGLLDIGVRDDFEKRLVKRRV